MIFAGLTGKTTIDVTGNASVSNAITTTNVWTSNIYASGKLSFAGLPNLTTLYASNLSVSNTILTTNVWTSNLISPGDITITGAVSTGITTLQVTGNTRVSHTVTSGNVYASGNIYVTADSQSVTGNIFMANALVTANLWTTTSLYAGVGAYVDKTVILTDPTLGALAATVYTGAGQGTIVRTGHMPMHPTLTTAPSGVWAGDTYFDNNFLNKYITSTWRPIELLYPTAVPVISAISNQVGEGVGQKVIVVNQTATPFSSLGTVLWTISGAPTGTVIEGGSNSGCFIVIPVAATALVGSYTVTVGASNERGSASSQSFGLTMPVPPSAGLYTFPVGSYATFSSSQSSAAQSAPTLAQAQSAMSGSPTPSQWNTTGSNFATDANGIQKWTVPVAGTYSIDAYGAAGGYGQNCSGQRPGYGSRVYGVFSLSQGQFIAIVPGRKGTDTTCGWGGGGGGGSFAWPYGQTVPYIAAGGGGGGSGSNTGIGDAPNSSSGNTGETSCNGGGAGGNGGNSGNCGSGGPCGGPGGQGWYGGTSSVCGGSVTWSALYNNPVNPHGAWCNQSAWGGFGGGGSSWGGAGGGGGYSGGGASGWSHSRYGGGGGFYNAGSSQTFSSTANSGEGFVTITRMT